MEEACESLGSWLGAPRAARVLSCLPVECPPDCLALAVLHPPPPAVCLEASVISSLGERATTTPTSLAAYPSPASLFFY